MGARLSLVLVFCVLLVSCSEVNQTTEIEPPPELEEVPKESDPSIELEEVEVKDSTIVPKEYIVRVNSTAFNPKNLVINKGDTVTWVNDHKSNMILIVYLDEEKYMDESVTKPGKSFSHTFDEKGGYNVYLNVVEGSISGRIEVKDEEGEKREKERIEKRKKDYSLHFLIEDINHITNVSYYNYSRNLDFPKFMESSPLKYYSIHTQNEQEIDSFDDFCSVYCAQNREDHLYYVNRTSFARYKDTLTEENFSVESKYKDYYRNRILANMTITEKVMEVENGNVLEYRFFMVEQTDVGLFKGNLFPYILLYKIPCAKNMTVFIKPKWEDFTVNMGASSVSQLIHNWILEDERVREELLNVSNQILERCPLQESFFDTSLEQNYRFSKLLSYYWRIYYEHHFNLSREMAIGVERKSKNSDKLVLKQVNVTFTNNEDFKLYSDLSLRIEVTPDDKHSKQYYEGKFIDNFQGGTPVKRSFKKKEIEFEDNITVEATLFTDVGKQNLRPLIITFTKEDLGFGKE